MAFVTIIEDDTGKKVGELLTTFHAYLLPDGSQMFVRGEPAWCHRCKQFCLVESLSSPEEMEKTSRAFYEHRLQNPLMPPDIFPVEEQAAMANDLLKSFLHQAEQWRIALQTRTSPPKCLSCGASDFIKLPENHDWMTHPGNPGRKVRERECTIHASMAEWGDLFDTEGNRIPERHASI